MEVSNDGRTSPSGSLNSSRERSNSDPGRREMTIVMNGGNTVPTRRTPAFINSTEVDSSVASANSTPSTPPPVRRSKLAVSIGRLLRPWKWRRRKKSQKFITTSQNLERKLSVRTNRDELIKKGILPVTSEEKENENDSGEVQCNGPSLENRLPNESEEKSVKSGQPRSALRTPLQQRDNLPAGNQIKNDFQVQQLDTLSMMDQLAQELARRNTGDSSTIEQTVLQTQNNRHCSSIGQQPRFVVVQSVGKKTSGEEECSDNESLQHASSGSEGSFSDSEEEEENRGIVTGLASKLKRKDSLAQKLRTRPSQGELEARNILPTKTEEEKLERKNEVGTKLIRRLSTRPTAQELRERNILKSSSEEEAKEEKEEKKRVLTRKLSRRPTVQELRAKKILKFNDYVECVDVHDYDRRADKPWTRLTPEDKAAIRKELNEFKSKEMEVHEDSRQYTRFHRP
ncbi:hypothetical protein pdam_00021592 [Pocillopora damicornis]|uniref:Phosphatase and actin regulator n=1 Tax=Pocillopora damicornis TaxID=46731 RepID=A0A3M6U4E8_POCDA|nr:phosphatase and actin regulator 1-like [Pocillopora damicornis]RMX48540.1 hypothetical protein pdam_00021592 [Pocillopora damicornis]